MLSQIEQASLQGAKEAWREPANVRAGATMLGVLAAIIAGVVLSFYEVEPFDFILEFTQEGSGVAHEGLALFSLLSIGAILTAGAFAQGTGRGPLPHAANITLKITLVASIVFMFMFPELPQLERKSLTARAVIFPLLSFGLLAGTLIRRRSLSSHPVFADLVITWVFASDITSNNLHWYGNWIDFDNSIHFVNSIPILMLVFASTLAAERIHRLHVGFWFALGFSLALYNVIHNMWEIVEYGSDRIAGTDLIPGGMAEATSNNLSGMAGSIVASVWMWRWYKSGAIQRAAVAPLVEYFSREDRPVI